MRIMTEWFNERYPFITESGYSWQLLDARLNGYSDTTAAMIAQEPQALWLGNDEDDF